MSTIWDHVSTNPTERPKYTRFELGRLVKLHRENELKVSITEVAEQYNVSEELWVSMEAGTRAFNFKIYKLIGDFLSMNDDELLEVEKDDTSKISFRSNDYQNPSIIQSVNLANMLFDEIVMQEKIGV